MTNQVSTTAADWVEPTDMKVVWSDEFNDPSIDRSKWMCETTATGWSPTWNNELQEYTDIDTGGNNAFIENGNLVIRGEKTPKGYTAARLATKGKHSWKHGRIAAKIKLPYGQGIWPAFWMLPENGNWPDAGEI
ncbi:MAG TPA: glycoside hydrolase family 16 protein, partial [Spirochaetota bacterium]